MRVTGAGSTKGKACSRNPELGSVKSALQERAERAPDDERLVATFVDPGVLQQLHAGKNYILYGRRGTGKTHLLKYRAHEAVRASRGVVAVYVDLSKTTDTEIAGQRADKDTVTSQLVHILKSLLGQLRDDVVRRRGEPRAELKAHFDELEAIVQAVRIADPEITAAQSLTEGTKDRGGLGAKVSATGASISADFSAETSSQRSGSTTSKGRGIPVVDFTALDRAFVRLLEAAEIELVLLLLDEWSDVKTEIQPELADVVLRAFMKNNRFAVEFGAIEYRCRFSRPLDQNQVVGFDHGSDVAQTVDLDEFYAFQGDDQRIRMMFSRLLFNHVCVAAAFAAMKRDESTPRGKFSRLFVSGQTREAPDQVLKELLRLTEASETWGSNFMNRIGSQYMALHFGTDDHHAFRAALFGPGAFEEIVTASGGVVRDFIKLFVRAFDRARQDEDRGAIGIEDVRTAASALYVSEKTKEMKPPQDEYYKELVRLALVEAGTPYFAVLPKSRWADPVHALLDQRIVHRVNRGYSDADNPGRLEGVYTLDYAVCSSRLQPDETPDAHFPESGKEDARGSAQLSSGRQVEVVRLPAD